MWMDDPWARVELNDENARTFLALADEWAEITHALAALCVELDTGPWADLAQVRAYERAVDLERSAREVAAQLWNVAT